MAVAIQWVELTAPRSPTTSGRAGALTRDPYAAVPRPAAAPLEFDPPRRPSRALADNSGWRAVNSRDFLSSGTATEQAFGYSRAVRAGAVIAVSGTTAMGADGPTAPDVAGQTAECLRRIEDALGQLGAALADVVRTRVFVTDITQWREVGLVHRGFFPDSPPATTIVQVAALFDPGLLVEIEADAVLPAA